jgi:hypothetical protein
MKTGYLSIETHNEHRGQIRILLGEEQPDLESRQDAAWVIRYIARFKDCEAGLMHAHEILKRRLLDPDSHLYRVSLEQAIAAIESIDLKHRRIYLDPDLSIESKKAIAALTQQEVGRRRRKDRVFKLMGYVGLGLLLFNLYLSFAR